jgi:hypothetical protein
MMDPAPLHEGPEPARGEGLVEALPLGQGREARRAGDDRRERQRALARGAEEAHEAHVGSLSSCFEVVPDDTSP